MAEHEVTRALLSVVAQAGQPMGVSDPHQADHPMIAVNAAFESLTGYPAGETVGRNCRFLQGPGTDRESVARIGRCIAAGRGCVEWLLNYRRDGSRFWNLLFMVPVFGPGGEVLHFLANQRDFGAEVPEGVPDYVLGRADLPMEGEAAFQALLAGVLAEGGPGSAGALERGIEAARKLNEITLGLRHAPWTG